MSYELHEYSQGMLDKTLSAYSRKVIVLKQDISCKSGMMFAGSVVYVEGIETAEMIDNQPTVTLELFDISAKVHDVLSIDAESNSRLSDVLESMFAVDDVKTGYYNEYKSFDAVSHKMWNADYDSDFAGLEIIGSLILMADACAVFALYDTYRTISYILAIAAIPLVFAILGIGGVAIHYSTERKVSTLKADAERKYNMVLEQ